MKKVFLYYVHSAITPPKITEVRYLHRRCTVGVDWIRACLPILPTPPNIYYNHEGLRVIPGGLFRKRTIITRAEQSYGRVPFAGLCRSFISVYVPGTGLPGARASASPAPRGPGICPDRAAYSAPAIDTHKAQCRWPWPFPPANIQWHWIRHP